MDGRRPSQTMNLYAPVPRAASLSYEAEGGASVVPPTQGTAVSSALATNAVSALPPMGIFRHERVGLGLRLRRFELETRRRDEFDPKRRSFFLGTINGLEEERETAVRPYLQFWFTPWVGVEAGWDRVGARTRTAYDGHSDGVFVARGPQLGLAVRLPNTTRVIPFAGLGRWVSEVSFQAEPWWGLGYADEGTWISLGRPESPRHGHRRIIETDGSHGTFWYVGCAVRLSPHWSLEVSHREVSLETDATFTVQRNGVPITSPLYGTIPLDHRVWGVGVSCAF